MSRSVEEAMRVLGVADSDPETVAHAYRRLARETHPDASPDPDAADRFATVAAAYRLLAACEPEPTEVRAHAAVPVRPGLAPVSADDGRPGWMATSGASPFNSAHPGAQRPIVAGPGGRTRTDQTEHPRSRKGETGDCRPGGRPGSVLHRSRLRDHRGQSADAAHLRAERSAVALPHPGRDTPLQRLRLGSHHRDHDPADRRAQPRGCRAGPAPSLRELPAAGRARPAPQRRLPRRHDTEAAAPW